MIEKSDCTDSMIFGISLTSNWRKRLATKFSADLRNAKASQCLAQLAIDAAHLSDSDWLRLQPHYGFDSKPWREAVSVATRQVGFTHKIKDFPAFLELLLNVLEQQSVVA
jgi:hypothetical protein